ncbi:MAG: MmcQ/YjbR family DNA-binding protein [Bacteroidota bacterium]
MYIDEFRSFCLTFPETREDQPFGPDVLVFKVCDKMFALLSLDEIPPRANLKCDPERAVALREAYAAVTPGYHMNKRHWNSVALSAEMPTPLVQAMVEASYRLVVAGLRKADRERLAET